MKHSFRQQLRPRLHSQTNLTNLFFLFLADTHQTRHRPHVLVAVEDVGVHLANAHVVARVLPVETQLLLPLEVVDGVDLYTQTEMIYVLEVLMCIHDPHQNFG